MVGSVVLLKRLWIPTAILIGAPLFLLGKVGICIFTLWLPTAYLIFDAIPTGIVTLIPLFIFPIFGVMKSQDMCQLYFADGSLLFFNSFVMAICLEETNAHRRIALNLLRLSGPTRNKMLFFFTVATTVISFFISDSATTAVMVVIAKAIMEAVADKTKKVPGDLRLQDLSVNDQQFCKSLLLSSAYASLIGGTAVITASPINVIFNTVVEKSFPGQEITYMQWLIFSLPFIPLYILAAYVIILCFCMGPKALFNSRSTSDEQEESSDEAMLERIRELHRDLGPLTFGELSVFSWLAVLVLLWIFRAPGFIPGWSVILPEGAYVTDATVSVLIATIMFFWPRSPRTDPSWTPIITWETMKAKFPFGFLLFYGMIVTIAQAMEKLDLETWITCKVESVLGELSPFGIQAVILGVSCITAEIGLGPFLLPIVLNISKISNLHPYYLGLPTTLSISYSFIVPIYLCLILIRDTGLISLLDLLRTGTVLKVACFLITLLNFNTYGYFILDIGNVSHIKEGNFTCQL